MGRPLEMPLVSGFLGQSVRRERRGQVTISHIYLLVGLSTECMTKAEAREVYGEEGPIGYQRTYIDFHRSRY